MKKVVGGLALQVRAAFALLIPTTHGTTGTCGRFPLSVRGNYTPVLWLLSGLTPVNLRPKALALPCLPTSVYYHILEKNAIGIFGCITSKLQSCIFLGIVVIYTCSKGRGGRAERCDPRESVRPSPDEPTARRSPTARYTG